MKDIDIAKEMLEKENLSLVVVKDCDVVYKSNDKGIKPMYYVVTNLLQIARGSSIADRVIGKGAAMLCKVLGVKEVYTPLISEAAIKVLKEANIPFSYHKSCPYIMNMQQTGLCPIEKTAMESENEMVFLGRLKDFLKINNIKCDIIGTK
jgi:hypothetical protein